MRTHEIEADERAVLVNRTAGYQAYRVMNWLLLIDLGLHGYRPGWTTVNGFPVDIFVVMEAGALTWLWYGWRGEIVSRRRAVKMALLGVIGLLMAVAVGIVLAQR